MRKIFVICGILICAILIASGYYRHANSMTVQLYFVDSSMQRLIASDFTVKTEDKEKAAKKVIRELLAGRDNNPKILRLMPNIKDGLTVRVKGQTAYVNMTGAFVASHSGSRQHEVLTIYSIVNSLASVKGIVNVKFTIDHKEQKNFKGFCDMRETFIPDYYV